MTFPRSTLRFQLLLLFLLGGVPGVTCRRCVANHSEQPQAQIDTMEALVDEASGEAAKGTDMFQDTRLLCSFALGIAFMHIMEVVAPFGGGDRQQRKFELYPYVL
eukprot:TRINITY_DN23845_c0_g1_i2.p1 TRINITY_DN23845_c0_g1~~TRINITY_DN23845_c0_g1_i2.p1  ORF type:complete len:105 (-),score=16.24 TRINITY_DN23845_c0_g1_i2:142-456(-)